MVCVSAGSKSGLTKAAGAEVAAKSRQEKLHAAVAKRISSQNAEKRPLSGHLFRSDVETWHAAVARSTFSTQNVKKRALSDHF